MPDEKKSEYSQRIWDKTRKPWHGETPSLDYIKRAMWRALYQHSDHYRRRYTTAEIRAACLIVADEAVNHGAVELGFDLYDIDETKKTAEKLLTDWHSTKREQLKTKV